MITGAISTALEKSPVHHVSQTVVDTDPSASPLMRSAPRPTVAATAAPVAAAATYARMPVVFPNTSDPANRRTSDAVMTHSTVFPHAIKTAGSTA